MVLVQRPSILKLMTQKVEMDMETVDRASKQKAEFERWMMRKVDNLDVYLYY